MRSRLVSVRPNTQWYNEEIAQAKLLRRQAERRWRKSHLEIHRQLYCKQRQHVQSLIKKAKTDYHSRQVEDCGKDTKQLFKVVNKLLNRKQSSPLPDHRCDKDLANQFSKFFTDKIANIRLSLSDVQVSDILELLSSGLCQWSWECHYEVSEQIMWIRPFSHRSNKKVSIRYCPSYDEHNFNASFETGDVPSELKTAIIRPTLKKPNLDKESLQNYRPISNLPFASKVMERISFSCLLDYLKENDLLDSHQSAYHPDHSVETLLTDPTDHSLRQMDAGNITAVVLLDMSSAFDTVDHPILIQRLRSSGVAGLALQWFKSYLTGRSQFVKVNDATSDPTPLTFGVPQGSVGGPLLFSLYLSPIY